VNVSSSLRIQISVSVLLGELEHIVVAIALNQLEVAWLVLVISQRNDLSELSLLGSLLVEVDLVTVNDDVLAEILVGIQTVIVWW
jgi:hypothetical protein